jgi:uncharacterized membrane protein YgdD (TMEM256/DUF423 family)
MLLGVAAGAFGAHGLKERLTPDLLAVWETAVRYQIYHALGLLALAALWDRLSARASTAGWCFLLGTLVFSGSLYALSLTGIRKLGAITPIGGLLFLAGWAALLTALRAK